MHVETGLNRKIYPGSHGRSIIVVGTSSEGLPRQPENPTYSDKIKNLLHVAIKTPTTSGSLRIVLHRAAAYVALLTHH